MTDPGDLVDRPKRITLTLSKEAWDVLHTAGYLNRKKPAAMAKEVLAAWLYAQQADPSVAALLRLKVRHNSPLRLVKADG